MELSIRNLQKEDFEVISKLSNELHKMHVVNRPDIYKDIDVMTLEEFNSILNSDKKYICVASVENLISGFCMYEICELENHEMINDMKYIHIDRICVDKDFRRKGIGKKLYEYVLKKASNLGVSNIELNVWSFNEDAIKFYESIGMNCRFIKYEKNIKY